MLSRDARKICCSSVEAIGRSCGPRRQMASALRSGRDRHGEAVDSSDAPLTGMAEPGRGSPLAPSGRGRGEARPCRHRAVRPMSRSTDKPPGGGRPSKPSSPCRALLPVREKKQLRRLRLSMIRKSGNRFSDEIMRKQRDRAGLRSNLISSRSSGGHTGAFPRRVGGRGMGPAGAGCGEGGRLAGWAPLSGTGRRHAGGGPPECSLCGPPPACRAGFGDPDASAPGAAGGNAPPAASGGLPPTRCLAAAGEGPDGSRLFARPFGAGSSGPIRRRLVLGDGPAVPRGRPG